MPPALLARSSSGLDVLLARTFLVGFAEAVGATEADAGAVGVAVTGSGLARHRTRAAPPAGRRTSAAGAGVFDGRSGRHLLDGGLRSAPASALAAGRAEGDAKR